ncbi:hypothetical protein [Thalassobacillus pellis]|uniref:hypothetical protein n=1 Tax=Thalassobacillus pellis TaxID=748008 RepID=UPI00195F3E7E|nr:hypothetical protein [Thalassobacillus pellis]MBM7553340.1 hypothetical protein [Thalassobacillus pellis]
MLYIWDIEKIIKNILEENNLDINYEANNNLSAPMSYNVSYNMIHFNYLEINGYMSKIKLNETKENFVKIILYHEIGYYLTFKKHKHDLRTFMYGEDDEVAQLKSEIETNAWEYGRNLVPEELLESYDKVREMNNQLIKGL